MLDLKDSDTLIDYLHKFGLGSKVINKFIKNKYGKNFNKITISNDNLMRNPKIIFKLEEFISQKISEICVAQHVKEAMKNKINDFTHNFFKRLLSSNNIENIDKINFINENECIDEYSDITLFEKIYVIINSSTMKPPGDFKKNFANETTIEHYLKMVFSIIFISFSSEYYNSEEQNLLSNCNMDSYDVIKYIFSYFCFLDVNNFA